MRPSTPASATSFREAFESVLEIGVVVAHQEKWGIRELASHCSRRLKTGLKSNAVEQGCGGTFLNGRAVREGITEGNAELDEVGACVDRGTNSLKRGVNVRIAYGEVGGGLLRGPVHGRAERFLLSAPRLYCQCRYCHCVVARVCNDAAPKIACPSVYAQQNHTHKCNGNDDGRVNMGDSKDD